METKKCFKCEVEFIATNEFYENNKINKDGLTGTCRKCLTIKRKEYRKNNKEHKNYIDKIYRENHKKESKEYAKKYYIENKKELTKFHKEYRTENRIEKAEKDKAYRNENIIIRKAYEKRYRDSNKLKLKLYRDTHKETIKTRMANYCKINKIQLIENRKQNRESINLNTRTWRLANPDKTREYGQKRRSLKYKLLATFTAKDWRETKLEFNNCCAYCGKEKPLTQDHFIALSKKGEYTVNNIIPSCQSCNSSKGNKDFVEWYLSFKYYSKKREKFLLEYLGYKNGIQQLKII